MTEQEAQEVLRDRDLVQAAVAPMQDIKRMHSSCLKNDIPAAMTRNCGKGG